MPDPRYGRQIAATLFLGSVGECFEDVLHRGGDIGIANPALPELNVVNLDGFWVEAGHQLLGHLVRSVGDASLGGQVWVLDDAAHEYITVLGSIETRLDKPESFALVAAVVRHVSHVDGRRPDGFRVRG